MSIEVIPTFAVGIDNGNSNFIAARFTADGEIKRVTFPSASEPGKLSDLAANKRMAGGALLNDADVLEPDDHVLVYNNQSWFVGKTAFDHAKIPSTGVSDTNRYKSDSCVRNILTGIASLVPAGTERCRIVMVMCLPLELSRNEDLVRDVRKKITGSAPCDITHNGHRLHIDEIRVPKILAESIAPALKDPILDALSATFDSGYRTFDLSKILGLVPQMNGYGTINIGVRNIAKYITDRCTEEYRFKLNQKHTEDILRAHVAMQRDKAVVYPSIQTARGEIDPKRLKVWIEDGCNIVGDQLIEQVAGILGTNDDGLIGEDLKIVRLVGGGFYFFYEKFRVVIAPQKIRMSEDPEYDTVDGLLWFAQEIVDRKMNAKETKVS